MLRLELIRIPTPSSHACLYWLYKVVPFDRLRNMAAQRMRPILAHLFAAPLARGTSSFGDDSEPVLLPVPQHNYAEERDVITRWDTAVVGVIPRRRIHHNEC